MARLTLAVACFVGAILSIETEHAQAQEKVRFPAPGRESAVLSIHAATDLYALKPLVEDFQRLSPDTTVDIVEYVTNDLFAAAIKACSSGSPLGDVYLSSAVDQMVKLANDGCAQQIDGPNLLAAPRWANWRDEVFGFTFEPIVIVYNRELVAAEDVPRSHLDLAELLRIDPETYQGKVGTYDIRISGIGNLLAFNDARQQTSTYGRLLESMGRAKVVLRCCTAEILHEIAAGKLLIGYNMLGSYAYDRMRQGDPLGIVMPADYTLVLSRGALVPNVASQSELAARFVDYLLSPRGQEIGRKESFFFGADGSAPKGIEGPDVVTSGIARPIAIGPTLLAVQDPARRQRFQEDWTKSVVQAGP
jgi:iron(III) transport system substrate-binding protein